MTGYLVIPFSLHQTFSSLKCIAEAVAENRAELVHLRSSKDGSSCSGTVS
ncbi:hypothetical protein MA16_Dca016147 [Dendrobium catenatum]|uniref:Uncharacterized protein n=1 Tax=Dendrobium catenatum TaxID=906689 RepID=A0A2I0WI70_9ASPA|nr:hypothetical protein MA16_Dca016147 [Dendrobium catenatum]